MKTIQNFIKEESLGGILLVFATLVALILSNSPLSNWYTSILHIPIEIKVGALHIDKHLYHWVNDGLMAVFFLLIGLEVKREVLEGELSSWSQIALPGIAAIGGMVIPAAIYIAFNYNDSFALQGWAIPTATDIAFALGILSLLGNRVPVSLKIFLMALAILDDLGAIIVIAIFYTSELSTLSISVATACLAILITLNRLGVTRKAAYILVGIVLWVSVLKSGVHATLAGVALAFTIPLGLKNRDGVSINLSKSLEHDLHDWVAFFILPLFAFVNAGIDIREIPMPLMASSVPLGIAMGLFFGKQLGVFCFSWAAIKLGITSLPKGSNWLQLYGVSVLTGIGFTMSLFIGSLAFTDDRVYQYTDKLAILLGSFASAMIGYIILLRSKKNSGL